MKPFSVINILYIGIFGLLISGCNLINPDESAPGYIEIKPFTYNPTPTLSVMGPSTSVKVRDVWVYIDNEFLGAYELPARFPVLKTGGHRLILSPGIELNGIASTRSPYPFYAPEITDVEIPANGTVTINPTFSYFESTECSFCESFEGSGFSLSNTVQSDTSMIQLPPGDPNIFEGSSSGVAYLDKPDTKFEITSTSEYPLPGANSAVYLELDYKINQQMQIGLFVIKPNIATEQIPLITLYPTSTWKKIYIQMGYVVSSYNSATNFKIYFGAIKDPAVTKSAFYLDNIKVVHF